MERSSQGFPMLPAACVHTHPFVLTQSFWQLLEQCCIFSPLMLFKMKHVLILCLLDTALFFFYNAEEGKCRGRFFLQPYWVEVFELSHEQCVCSHIA